MLYYSPVEIMPIFLSINTVTLHIVLSKIPLIIFVGLAWSWKELVNVGYQKRNETKTHNSAGALIKLNTNILYFVILAYQI